MMKRRMTAFTLIVIACFLNSGTMAEERNVSWNDLAPVVASEPVANPFLELTSDQINSLRKLLRTQQAGASQSIDADLVAEVRAQLAADGLDVDWLFEQRRLMMERAVAEMRATNEDIIGQSVRLPGYVLPLEMKDQKVVEFLLVPTVGACIHTPPPPANQMVRVVYPEGIEVGGLYEPVWISGVMNAESSRPEVGYVDGRMEVDVTYAMQPTSVLP